jgi:hypothetical protein
MKNPTIEKLDQVIQESKETKDKATEEIKEGKSAFSHPQSAIDENLLTIAKKKLVIANYLKELKDEEKSWNEAQKKLWIEGRAPIPMMKMLKIENE